MSTFAHVIDTATKDQLMESVGRAPLYEAKFASAIQRTIEVIHGLERLHQLASIHELEVYLGRASESTLLGRFKSHQKDRRHRYGTVLFSCPSQSVRLLEKAGIRIMKTLKTNDALCVGNANVASDGRGGEPAGRNAIVYMTWRKLDRAVLFDKPGVALIRDIACEVEADLDGAIARGQIERGLSPIRSLSQREDLEWYPQ